MRLVLCFFICISRHENYYIEDILLIFTMVYTLKTQINDSDVNAFLNSIEDLQKKEDSFILLDMFSKISGEKPKMWWTSIIGFWLYSYVSKSRCVGDWMRTGFAPRKAGLSIYIMPWYDMGMEWLLEKLWKYKMWKSCLTIKKLSDIDLKVLEKIIKKGFDIMDEKYPKSSL